MDEAGDVHVVERRGKVESSRLDCGLAEKGTEDNFWIMSESTT